MFDEPLSNLDAMLRTDMRSEIKHLHQQLKATTVYVTHDQVEALTLSDKIVVMNKGKVQQHDTPFEIYHHPTNLFVAEFIGDPRINLFESQILRNDTEQEIDLGVIRLALSDLPENTPRNVIASIRPEAIKVIPEAQIDADCIKTELINAQPTGSETILFTRTDDINITALTSGFVPMDAGQTVWLKIDAKDINLFDPVSRQNLKPS